jgi:hypothetical protein
MGQFASKAFDGDPYIDIMRALPDKGERAARPGISAFFFCRVAANTAHTSRTPRAELVWWVQKVIWVSARGHSMRASRLALHTAAAGRSWPRA